MFARYKSQIKFTSDTSFTVSFTSKVIVIDDIKKASLPYGIFYESTLTMAIISEKAINLASLNRIRTSFVEAYFNKESHLEAYNYWILSEGDGDAFKSWRETNEAKWQKFVDWFGPNKLKLDDNNKFLRTR